VPEKQGFKQQKHAGAFLYLLLDLEQIDPLPDKHQPG